MKGSKVLRVARYPHPWPPVFLTGALPKTGEGNLHPENRDLENAEETYTHSLPGMAGTDHRGTKRDR